MLRIRNAMSATRGFVDHSTIAPQPSALSARFAPRRALGRRQHPRAPHCGSAHIYLSRPIEKRSGASAAVQRLGSMGVGLCQPLGGKHRTRPCCEIICTCQARTMHYTKMHVQEQAHHSALECALPFGVLPRGVRALGRNRGCKRKKGQSKKTPILGQPSASRRLTCYAFPTWRCQGEPRRTSGSLRRGMNDASIKLDGPLAARPLIIMTACVGAMMIEAARLPIILQTLQAKRVQRANESDGDILEQLDVVSRGHGHPTKGQQGAPRIEPDGAQPLDSRGAWKVRKRSWPTTQCSNLHCSDAPPVPTIAHDVSKSATQCSMNAYASKSNAPVPDAKHTHAQCEHSADVLQGQPLRYQTGRNASLYEPAGNKSRARLPNTACSPRMCRILYAFAIPRPPE